MSDRTTLRHIILDELVVMEPDDDITREMVAGAITSMIAVVVEDGPLIDRDRGIAVIRLDPELAQFLADWADDIWKSGDLRAVDHADALERAARLIGGEFEW